MDNITGTDNLPSSGVEVTYTRESIDDSVGDTVSSDNAQTLQEAINAAPDGEETVISLKKHVKLSSTLKVPAGKKIKITSDDPYTISAIKSGFSGLVDVAEGASLESPERCRCAVPTARAPLSPAADRSCFPGMLLFVMVLQPA